jgi:hypothetical protein
MSSDNFIPNDYSKTFKEVMDENEKYMDEIVDKTDYETRLAVTAWVFKNIIENAKDGGSFRCLIYDKLGYKTDAYCPLLLAGGMEITNELELKKDRL